MAGLNPTTAPKGRAADLDLFKTLLVVVMIGAHVVQLITANPGPQAQAWSNFANIASFSGFMFAFGIGIGLPKARDRKGSVAELLRPALRLLIAVYVSSFAFALLLDRKRLDMALVVDVVTMRRLFGWSEFLATFFALYVLIALLRPVLVFIGRTPWLLAMVSSLGLLSTFVTTSAIVPLLPTLIGHRAFASFPLLAYSPWFLLGIWYGSHPVRGWHFLPAIVATGIFAWTTWQTGEYPGRFPPTALWVVGPAAVLLACLAGARWLIGRVRIPEVLLTPGRHVLSFLVVSILALFTTRALLGKPVRSTLVALGVTAGVLIVLSAFWWALERARQDRRQSA